MSCTYSELLDEWHELVTHTVSFLEPSRTPYLVTWKRIFSSTKSKTDFKNILYLIELTFCLPVSTSKVERSFSLLKRIKTDTRCSLGTERVENIMRICQEGPPLNEFDATPVVKRWVNDKVRRVNQNKRNFYKTRLSYKKNIGLSSSSENESSSDETT